MPSRAFCVPSGYLTLPETESRNQFDAALLLSEVAATGTVAEVVPGFSPTGLPAVLLVLSDVAPLHSRSPSPAYVLVPMDRLVIADRVFCASAGLGIDGYRPAVGQRVVVVGSWGTSATTPVGPGFQGLMAWIVDDEESLKWVAGFGPKTWPEMLERVEEVVSGDLFRLTAHLSDLPPASTERVQFGDLWVEELLGTGCRVVGAEALPDGGFRLERTCKGLEVDRVP